MFNMVKKLFGIRLYMMFVDDVDGGGGETSATIETPAETTDETPPASWRDGLPDDIRSHPVTDKYDSPAEVVKALVNAQELIGRKGVILPKEGDSEEVVKAYREAMNIPDSPEGYELPDDIKTPENFVVDKFFVDELLKGAHENGLSKEQTANMYKRFIELEGTMYEQIQSKIEEQKVAAKNSLISKWGSAYEERMSKAKQVLQSIGGEELINELDDTQLGNLPQLSEFMYKISGMLSEDSLKGANTSFTKTPAQAQAEITDIKQNKQNPRNAAYYDRNNPAHAEAVEYVSQLFKMSETG